MTMVLALLRSALGVFPWVFGLFMGGRARRAERRAADLEGQLKRKDAEDEVDSLDDDSVAEQLRKHQR